MENRSHMGSYEENKMLIKVRISGLSKFQIIPPNVFRKKINS